MMRQKPAGRASERLPKCICLALSANTSQHAGSWPGRRTDLAPNYKVLVVWAAASASRKQSNPQNLLLPVLCNLPARLIAFLQFLCFLVYTVCWITILDFVVFRERHNEQQRAACSHTARNSACIGRAWGAALHDQGMEWSHTAMIPIICT